MVRVTTSLVIDLTVNRLFFFNFEGSDAGSSLKVLLPSTSALDGIDFVVCSVGLFGLIALVVLTTEILLFTVGIF